MLKYLLWKHLFVGALSGGALWSKHPLITAFTLTLWMSFLSLSDCCWRGVAQCHLWKLAEQVWLNKQIWFSFCLVSTLSEMHVREPKVAFGVSQTGRFSWDVTGNCRNRIFVIESRRNRWRVASVIVTEQEEIAHYARAVIFNIKVCDSASSCGHVLLLHPQEKVPSPSWFQCWLMQ